MTTTFTLLAGACGLSHREAAAFLDVRIDTVKSWSAGRNPVPAGVVAQLADLAQRIIAAADEAAEHTRELIGDGDAPEAIELGVASDDHEARTLGWPCAGAHKAVIGWTAAHLIADGHAVEILPRGTTIASAGASDAHGR